MSNTSTEQSVHVPPKGTKFRELLGELNAGVFEEKLDAALSACALNTALYGEKGKVGEVTIKLTLSRIGESSQVAMKHTLEFRKPTTRGHATEKDTTETPLHVGRGGRLTVTPDTQTTFAFDTQSR